LNWRWDYSRAGGFHFGRAARVSGIPQSDFLRELGRREIPIHYDPDDFEADLKTICGVE